MRVYLIEWTEISETNECGLLLSGGNQRRSLVVGRGRDHAWDLFVAEWGSQVDFDMGASQTNIPMRASVTEMF